MTGRATLRTAVPRRVRLMLVDDSIVARSVLSSILEPHPEFEVVATASGAAQAIARLAVHDVDVVLLDLAMPGTDGLTALPGILAAGRGARVLVVSASAARGAADCVQALTLGATDTVGKPSAGLGAAFADELLAKLRRMPAAAFPAMPVPVPARAAPCDGTVECLAIGASTGGPHALAALFDALPAAFAVPTLVTQHLPAPFMPYFAEQIGRMTGRATRIARDGDDLRGGEVLIAPGDGNLTVTGRGGQARVAIVPGRTTSGCLPSVDPMFASVADAFGARAFGVVLSGMGRDGLEGARRLVAAGGELSAQDPGSSVVWGMPGAVASAGLAALVAPPAAIAARIAARLAEPARRTA